MAAACRKLDLSFVDLGLVFNTACQTSLGALCGRFGARNEAGLGSESNGQDAQHAQEPLGRC